MDASGYMKGLPKVGPPVPEFWPGPERFFVFIFWLGLYYLWYRYPFMINSVDTSQLRYSGTPFWLQALKYAIYAGFLYAAILLLTARHAALSTGPALNRRHVALFPVLLYLALYPVIVGLVSPGHAAYLFQVGFFITLPVVAIMFDWDQVVLVRSIVRSIDVFIIAALSVELLQVALFLAYGRLPGLASAGTFMIRFGSIWDDPNGFAVTVPFLAGFSYYRYRGVYRWTVLCLLLLALYATISFTGYISFCMAMFFWVVTVMLGSDLLKRAGGRMLALAAGVFLVLGVILFAAFPDYFIMLVRLKSGSISDHINSFREILGLFSPEAAIGIGSVEPGEPGWLNLLTSLGVVYTACYAYVMAVLSVKWFRVWVVAGEDERLHKPLAAGFFMLTAAVAVGMGNLPFEGVFPVNLLVAVGFAAVLLIEKGGFPAAGTGARPR